MGWKFAPLQNAHAGVLTHNDKVWESGNFGMKCAMKGKPICGSRDWSQRLMHAEQVLYQWDIAPAFPDNFFDVKI